MRKFANRNSIQLGFDALLIDADEANRRARFERSMPICPRRWTRRCRSFVI